MGMDELTTIIGQVGFPMAVAAYLLIRMEGTMKELTKAVTALTASTTLNAKTVGRRDPAQREG